MTGNTCKSDPQTLAVKDKNSICYLKTLQLAKPRNDELQGFIMYYFLFNTFPCMQWNTRGFVQYLW